MLKMLQTFYPDIKHGSFTSDNINVLKSTMPFSCSRLAVGAPNSAHDWVGVQVNNETDANSAVQVAFSVDGADQFVRRCVDGAWGAWTGRPASQINVADASGYYESDSLEGVLDEIGSQLAENADNAALWRKTTTGNPATCYPVPESPLYPKVSLVATQEGSGDPSPENIRPIVPALVNGGKVTLSHSDGVITPTQYEWTAPQDIWGGSVDWESDRLTVTHAQIASYSGESVPDGWISSTGGLDTGAQIVYPLATPTVIPLTDLPAIPAIAQLDRYTPRQNVLTADKGALTVGYAKSPIREADELAAAIAEPS